MSHLCLDIRWNSHIAYVFTCINKLSVFYNTPSTEGNWLRISSSKMSLALKQGSCAQITCLPTQNGPWVGMNCLGRPLVTVSPVEDSNSSLSPTMTCYCLASSAGTCEFAVIESIVLGQSIEEIHSHRCFAVRDGCPTLADILCSLERQKPAA